jgi:hypothetical protein
MNTNNNSNSNNNSKVSKYPSQAVLMQFYGCNKYELADKMRNYMHIDDKYLPALAKYRMMHCSGIKFSTTVVDGTISMTDHVNSGLFNVIYHNCNPFNAKRAKEVRLSFRAAMEEFNLEPIVLVEIVSDGMLTDNWRK